MAHDDRLRAAWLAVQIADHQVEIALERLELVIIDHHHEGLTVSEIARRTHQSRAQIYRILHKHNAFDSNTHRENEGFEDAS